jgi:hypothetical protein
MKDKPDCLSGFDVTQRYSTLYSGLCVICLSKPERPFMQMAHTDCVICSQACLERWEELFGVESLDDLPRHEKIKPVPVEQAVSTVDPIMNANGMDEIMGIGVGMYEVGGSDKRVEPPADLAIRWTGGNWVEARGFVGYGNILGEDFCFESNGRKFRSKPGDWIIKDGESFRSVPEREIEATLKAYMTSAELREMERLARNEDKIPFKDMPSNIQSMLHTCWKKVEHWSRDGLCWEPNQNNPTRWNEDAYRLLNP